MKKTTPKTAPARVARKSAAMPAVRKTEPKQAAKGKMPRAMTKKA